MHLSQTWVLHVQNPSASTGKLMSSVIDRPHSSSRLQRSPSHQACQILMEQVKSLCSLATSAAGLSTCIFQSCVKPPWKSPHWKKLNQTRAASHVSCSSGGGWPRYSHSRHHFPCSSCSPGLPSLSHNQCTSTPLQCLWIPFQGWEDHRYLTSWKLTETHFGVNRELSGSLS